MRRSLPKSADTDRGKPVVVKFDGGLLSSDGGVLALREVEQRLRLADRLAACIVDP
ncbi:MAG: transposase, partial [Stellaceae bacterium]